MRWMVGAAVWLSGLLLGVSSAAAEDAYSFVGDERISLRVGEWNSTDGLFQTWEGITGDYLVDAAGTLSIPVAGRVEVAGKTAAEVSDDLALIFQRQIGLPDPPAVAIEIAEYRPVYVLGAVMAPGSYRFNRTMTVEQALAVAGGLFRLSGETGASPSSRAIQMQNDIDRLGEAVGRLQTVEARLLAEIAAYDAEDLDGAVTFAGSDSDHGRLERTILETNREAIRTRRQSLQESQALLTEQVSRLDAEIILRDGQIASAREDLANATDLAGRGLAVASRVSDLSFALSEYEAKRLQLDVARLTAEQRLNEARREEAGLFKEARAARLSELKLARTDLDDARVRLLGARRLFAETSLSSASASAAVMPVPGYRVSRLTDEGVTSLQVGLTDPLHPGDTLTVEFQWPDAPAN
jgi:protein involved in polysaccharide export with SLBB domain